MVLIAKQDCLAITTIIEMSLEVAT